MSRVAPFGQLSEITDYLYLSGAGCCQPERLRQRGITFICNVTTEEPSLHLQGIDYLRIRIEDAPRSRLDQYFDMVADRIRTVRERGGRALVHCVAGVSRSATLVIVYMMKHERMTLRQAYFHVRAARSIIRPNVGFWQQMIDYERKLRGSNTVTMVEHKAVPHPIPDLYCAELKRHLVAQLEAAASRRPHTANGNGSKSAVQDRTAVATSHNGSMPSSLGNGATSTGSSIGHGHSGRGHLHYTGSGGAGGVRSGSAASNGGAWSGSSSHYPSGRSSTYTYSSLSPVPHRRTLGGLSHGGSAALNAGPHSRQSSLFASLVAASSPRAHAFFSAF